MAVNYFLDEFGRFSVIGEVENGWLESEILPHDVECVGQLQFNEGAEVRHTEPLVNRFFTETIFTVDFSNTSQTLTHWFYVYFASKANTQRLGLRFQLGGVVRFIRNYISPLDGLLDIVSDWSIGYEQIRVKIIVLKYNVYLYLWNGSDWIKSSTILQAVNPLFLQTDWLNPHIRVKKGTGTGSVDINVTELSCRNLSPNLARVDS